MDRCINLYTYFLDSCQPSASGLQRYQIWSSDEDETTPMDETPLRNNEIVIDEPTRSFPRDVEFIPDKFPEFDVSGLPGHLVDDWAGAKYYLGNFFTLVEKSSLLQNSFFLKSRSITDSVRRVSVQQNRDVICDCKRYNTTQGK